MLGSWIYIKEIAKQKSDIKKTSKNSKLYNDFSSSLLELVEFIFDYLRLKTNLGVISPTIYNEKGQSWFLGLNSLMERGHIA